MTKLFILHGWTYQTATWEPLLALLRERGIDFEFLHIPGLTDGTNPTWTLDEYVEWLKERTASCDKVILYGHSNGGRISLAFVAKYPEKAERLILEDSAGIPPRGLRKLKRDFFRSLSGISRRLVRSESARKALYKLIRENDYANATPEMKRTLSNLVSVDLTSILPKIICPTLIIWGAHDKTTPVKSGELMKKLIPNARLVVLPSARHSPHITHPAELAELIEKELRA